MSLTIYTQKDLTTSLLKDKTIGIIGFGAQGKAQALNLRDSGLKVKIALKSVSKSIPLAQELGFEVCTLQEVAQECDVIAFLLPDEWHKQVFDEVAPYLKRNQVLLFSHGFSIHFKEITPPPFVDVIMVAPKGAGKAVRDEYVAGRGIVSLIGVEQNHSGEAKNIALEYACGLGSGRSAIFESSFKDECECDLFSEQSVICGGLDALIRAGFETLVEAGYPEEIAYFECLHEVKLVADLIYANGLQSMREHISNTAEFGDIMAGKQIITAESKEAMREILRKIQSGEFAKSFLKERDTHFPKLRRERKILQKSQIEEVGKKMRGLMPWVTH
ncbi:ketol-acid reductoisomerase [Helicobacter brantae]|uniref:Ketol-acid reductoisomerase (NADP(+)) n=1 Tax=Helicobacter brantae TaxID=375927 RepID=A0A3D8J3X6_9HELI|nr:ketol-acid reductoisomerase [Helicobacter brantae]RDU71471.1 ketol-acid reductoisomerase [Helicobacter brantae]